MVKSVIICEEAYRQILRFAVEFANPKRSYRQWREVIGWLVGTVDEETVTIMRAIPMTSGSSIFVEVTDYNIIPKIAEEAEKTNAIIVGWFHSHPSFGFFLSGIDIRTQRYQQNLFENAIALVCDPTKVSEIESGIHGFQVSILDDHEREYHELDVKTKLNDIYPSILRDLLTELEVTETYSEIIAYEELSSLYALEGITPPSYAYLKAKNLLTSEIEATPILEAEYLIVSPIKKNKECYLQVKISNLGEGIAWRVDFFFDPGPNFKLLSMYPRRIVDQLTYQSTIIETFKIKPISTGDLFLARTIISYELINQKKFTLIVPPIKVLIQEAKKEIT